MARVNIEERFFGESRLYFCAQMLNERAVTVTGILAHLWHDSQEELKVIGSKKEIIRWSRYSFDADENEKLVSALVEAGYISPSGENFLIHGNEPQIETRVRRMNASVKGGRRTKEKWEKAKESLGFSTPLPPSDATTAIPPSDTRPKPEHEQATPRPLGLVKPVHEQASGGPIGLVMDSQDQAVNRLNSMQFNAMQFNSENKEVNPPDFAEGEAKPPMPSANAPGDSPLNMSKLNISKKWEERITAFDRQMAERWMSFATEQIPTAKFNLRQFEVAIAKMRYELKLSEEKIEQLLEWIRADGFWSANAISPVEAIKRKNGVCKLERILVQMDKPASASGSSRPQKEPLRQADDSLMKRFLEGQERIKKEWLEREVPLNDDEQDLAFLC